MPSSRRQQGPSNPDCIFCKIIAGEIPSYKVYEDEAVFAFLDIGPVVGGHMLVIPKAHHANLVVTPPEILAAVSARLPKLAEALLAATGCPACHILTNNGVEASQSVQHLHFHIMPRKEGDGYQIPWPTGKLETKAAKKLVTAIQNKL